MKLCWFRRDRIVSSPPKDAAECNSLLLGHFQSESGAASIYVQLSLWLFHQKCVGFFVSRLDISELTDDAPVRSSLGILIGWSCAQQGKSWESESVCERETFKVCSRWSFFFFAGLKISLTWICWPKICKLIRAVLTSCGRANTVVTFYGIATTHTHAHTHTHTLEQNGLDRSPL